ncbi:MAG: helix-turn-helix domain-containing protein [Pseudomonadales bacterium]
MTKNKKKNSHIGSSLDDFLAEDGLLAECETLAIKEILADQIRQAMEDNQLTKTAMAKRMGTSRRALERLLDIENTSITLHTMQKAASAVGRQLRLQLV